VCCYFKSTYNTVLFDIVVMNTGGDKDNRFQVQGAAGVYYKGPQEEAGNCVQGQVEGHTQGFQKGNSIGREKASNVVREIRQ
jgi:hypothetical protein